jgi:hypothetical protein
LRICLGTAIKYLPFHVLTHAQRTRIHFCPQNWLLCHLGLSEFEFEYLRRTTSAAAGNGLGTTIKYLRQPTSGSAGNGMGNTIKYLGQSTSSTAGNGRAQRSSTCDPQRGRRDHVPATRSERRRVQWPGPHDQLTARRRENTPEHRDQAPATHSERCRGQRPRHHCQVPAAHNERRGQRSRPHNLLRIASNFSLSYDLNLRSLIICFVHWRPGSFFCALSFQEETNPAAGD